jgi:uncharacterized membrane protein YkoI
MRILSGVVTAIALILMASLVRADEEKIPLDKLPKAVVDAVKAKFDGAELVSADKEVEKGKTLYEVNIKYKGSKMDVTLTEDGKIVSVEKEIDAKDLPKAVAEAVSAKYKDAKILKAEEITEGDKTFYEVLLDLGDKKKMEMKLDPTGKIVEEEKK